LHACNEGGRSGEGGSDTVLHADAELSAEPGSLTSDRFVDDTGTNTPNRSSSGSGSSSSSGSSSGGDGQIRERCAEDAVEPLEEFLARSEDANDFAGGVFGEAEEHVEDSVLVRFVDGRETWIAREALEMKDGNDKVA
jgi:hypothetical protein